MDICHVDKVQENVEAIWLRKHLQLKTWIMQNDSSLKCFAFLICNKNAFWVKLVHEDV